MAAVVKPVTKMKISAAIADTTVPAIGKPKKDRLVVFDTIIPMTPNKKPIAANGKEAKPQKGIQQPKQAIIPRANEATPKPLELFVGVTYKGC